MASSNQEDLLHKNSELEAKLEEIKEQYSACQKDLKTAAEFGKKLLEENSGMLKRMEDQQLQHKQEHQALEQEKYNLQQSLKLKESMEQEYIDEIEGIRKTLRAEKEDVLNKAETEYKQQISMLKQQVQQQQTDVNSLNLSEKQLRNRNGQLEVQLKETQVQLQQKVGLLNETCTEEIAGLHSDISALQQDKISLERDVSDKNDLVEQLSLQVKSAKDQVEFKNKEVEDYACQVTSYCNLLEKSREQMQELQVELDLLKMKSQDQKAKGNSLFSEVEDRRIVAEKELINMKVEYKSLRNRYEASRQNYCSLKMQLAGLLQSCGSRADTEYLESLRQQLQQKTNEVEKLMNKLSSIEKSKDSGVMYAVPTGEVTESNNVSFYQALLKRKEQQIGRVERELQSKALEMFAQSEKLMSCESQLYQYKTAMEAANASILKLQVKLEELQLKYEPEKLKTSDKVRKVVYEKIKLTEEDKLKIEARKKQEESSGGPESSTQLKDGESRSDRNRDKDILTTLTNRTENTGESKPPGTDCVKKSGNVPGIDDIDSTLTQCLKKKTVSISDENEVIEMKENDEERTSNTSSTHDRRVRGRKQQQRVVHINELQKLQGDKPNQCPSQ